MSMIAKKIDHVLSILLESDHVHESAEPAASADQSHTKSTDPKIAPWMNESQPFRVVLLGGGLANTQVIKTVTRQSGTPSHIELILVSDHEKSFYSGMCPGSIAGQYKEDDLSVDLDTIGSFFGWKLVKTRIETIDADNNRLISADGRVIEYDLLSINIGSTNSGARLTEGVKEHAICTRPLKNLMPRIEREVERLLEEHLRNEKKVFEIVTIGGGCAGCELTLGMQHRLSAVHGLNVRSTIVTSRDTVLSSDPDALRECVNFVLTQRGVDIITNCKAVRCSKRFVTLSDGRVLPCDLLLWATGPAPHPLRTSLDQDESGYVLVNRGLQSTSHPNVFASGDCVAFHDFPRGHPPRAGVFAVRQGPVLIGNLCTYFFATSDVKESDLSLFEPQKDFLRLLNTGDGAAIGCRFGIAFRGAWVWQLKDWIDLAWMKKFDADLLQNEDNYVCIPSVSNMDEEISPQGAVALLRHVDKPSECKGFDAQWKVLVRMMKDDSFRDAVLQAMR